MKNFLLALAMVVSLTSVSQAALLFEPMINVNMAGEIDGGDDLKAGTFGMGARLGYQMMGLQLGVDYQQNALTTDASPEVDGDSTEIAAFIGYDFPVLLRVFAGYAVGGKLATDGSADFEGISGMKFGIGLKLFPLISINLEQKNYNYDEQGGSAIDQDISMTTLSISLPLTF
ncbi:MAG: hypothetical protein JNM93_05760 [Bacteriovoracaceae bacterium]|nr:hypothetical protein [Bacteriovoracaceae bacterium]